MAPFLSDEVWVLIATHLAQDVRSLGRLACVSRRFNAKVVPTDLGTDSVPRFFSVVVEGARRACEECSPHVANCAPRISGQPHLRLLWERQLLSRAASFAAVGPTRAAQRTEFSDAGAVACQPRMPLGEQREVWASGESQPAFALVHSQDNSAHTATCIVLENSQLVVGAIPLRAGQHYMELELIENGLQPHVQGDLPGTAGSIRFGVVSGALAWSASAPHALWQPEVQLNPRSPWAQFTDARGRNYYVRDQDMTEIAEHDNRFVSAEFATNHRMDEHSDTTERMLREPAAIVVDPNFASAKLVVEALSYEAVASVSAPREGVQVRFKDEDTDDYDFDTIAGQQWMYDTVNGDLVRGDEIRSTWLGQRGAKEKDCVGLLLDVEAGTLDMHLNDLHLGTLARGLRGHGPFRFAVEIFTDAKVRVAQCRPGTDGGQSK